MCGIDQEKQTTVSCECRRMKDRMSTARRKL